MTANYMLKKESKKTNCHSGLDPESSARAHNTKAYHASGCPIGSGMTGESGRSMIEMLGVLAIIGVLSVGGIAGYTTAMRSHKANEIVNATSMIYMLGLAQNAGEGTGTLKYTETIGASLSNLKEITYNNGTVTVAITDDAVCNQVMTKLGSKATGNCTTATDGAYTLTVNFGEGTVNAAVCTSPDCCTEVWTGTECCLSMHQSESCCDYIAGWGDGNPWTTNQFGSACCEYPYNTKVCCFSVNGTWDESTEKCTLS